MYVSVRTCQSGHGEEDGGDQDEEDQEFNSFGKGKDLFF